MSIFMPLHTSPLDSRFHWEYQVLVVVILAGLWLFLAGRVERRRLPTDRRERANLVPSIDGERSER